MQLLGIIINRNIGHEVKGMKKKKRLIGFICLFLAASIVVPSIPAEGNAARVLAAGKKAKKNGLVKKNGGYCYYKKGKLLKKTWKTIKRKKYYFKADGRAAVGSCKIRRKYYIFNAKGQLVVASKKKIVTVRGVKYQVKAKGLAAGGWSKDKKYYFSKNGKMTTGICVIGEKFYKFHKNGEYDDAGTKQLRSAAVYEKDMGELYRLIGQPVKSEYFDGCYGPGKDGILTYKNYTVYTYKAPDGNEIFMGAE